MSSPSRKMIDCPSLRCRALIPNFSQTSDLVTKALQDCVNCSLNSQFIQDMRHFLFGHCSHSYYLSSFYTLIRNICLGMQKKFITSGNPYTWWETRFCWYKRKVLKCFRWAKQTRFYCLVQQMSGKAHECIQCSRGPSATPTYHGSNMKQLAFFIYFKHSLKIMSHRSHSSLRNVR